MQNQAVVGEDPRILQQATQVPIATGYGLDDQGVGVQVPVGAVSSRPALGPIQHPIQYEPKGSFHLDEAAGV
jgi:hypothetical protein